MAAMDINHAKIFGRCEAKTGIRPFELLVEDVMSKEPYCSARRVFWIVDNGSLHRGQSSIERIETKWPNVLLVHTPIHASWSNQIEIYFSIVQRKVLIPNDFSSLAELEEAVINFQNRYEKIAKPFERKYTKNDLSELMKKLDRHAEPLAL